MPTIHISEAEAARDFPGLIAHVRSDAEVVIEMESKLRADPEAIAVVRPATSFEPRLLSESIALARKYALESGNEPRMDPDFAALALFRSKK